MLIGDFIGCCMNIVRDHFVLDLRKEKIGLFLFVCNFRC